MPIRSRTDLLAAIERLPNNVTFLRHSYKKGWLNWLSNYEDPSRVTPDRNAEFIYNALNMPEWMIWLAAATGVDHELIDKAALAIDRKEFRQTQAAAVRDILPWESVAQHLENPKGRAA